jgi:hypothetical protein
MLTCAVLILAFFQSSTPLDQTLSASAPGSSAQDPTSGPAKSNSAENSARDPQKNPEGSGVEKRKPGWTSEAPIPATTGTPGLFTVSTAEVLPKNVFTISGYANKVGRAPGSVTALSGGVSLAAGITRKITAYAQFEPYRHLHIGEPSELSLRQPPGCPHDVYKAPVYCGVNSGIVPDSWTGPAAAYVPDFPFAAYNTTDIGPVTLGVKVNFWSETRGDPLSVAVSVAGVIPTRSAAWELANHGTQLGTFNYSFGLALSKTLFREVVLANNVTYLVTRNPSAGGITLFTLADQMIFGQGFIFRAQHSLQFMTEYTCEMGQEGHAFGVIGTDTENTTLGPGNPVDGVWGARWYLANSAAIDVGYRYMLNLHQVNDRSGFTIKISKVFGWSKR